MCIHITCSFCSHQISCEKLTLKFLILSNGLAMMTEGLKSTRQEHGLFQFLTGGKNTFELRLWSVAAPHGNVAASPAPRQTLILPHQRESSSRESVLLSIIPGGEFLVASDPTQNLLYVANLTYNSGHNVAGLAKIAYLRLVSYLLRLHMICCLSFYLESRNYQKAFFC